MFCQNCSCDKFDTVKVYRNRRFDPIKRRWRYSDNHDTRKVLCVRCGQAYITETVIIDKVVLLDNGQSSVPPVNENAEW